MKEETKKEGKKKKEIKKEKGNRKKEFVYVRGEKEKSVFINKENEKEEIELPSSIFFLRRTPSDEESPPILYSYSTSTPISEIILHSLSL